MTVAHFDHGAVVAKNNHVDFIFFWIACYEVAMDRSLRGIFRNANDVVGAYEHVPCEQFENQRHKEIGIFQNNFTDGIVLLDTICTHQNIMFAKFHALILDIRRHIDGADKVENRGVEHK
jgi:hypothetical protein